MSNDDNGEGEPLVTDSLEVAASYSGPLPPPEWLRQYEEVLPGIADRMMTVVESTVSEQHLAAEHQRGMDRQVVNAGITIARRGQILASLMGLGFLVAAVVLTLAGQSILGGTLGLAIMAAIVTTFRMALQREREERHTHH